MNDPILVYFLLCGSALAAGVVNAVAGGGTLLTFPALLGAVDAVMANGTSTVALAPGSFAGALGYRREVAQARRPLLWLLPPSLLGGAVGALLVTRLDKKIFETLIPWLILAASLLLVAQPWISRRLQASSPSAHGGLPRPVAVVAQFAIAVYGGYFGAGIGILMLSTLGLMGLGDIHRMNAVKTVLAFTLNSVAAALFILEGQVHWPFALAMMSAASAGGYLGAHGAQRLPQAWVRALVIAIGFGLAGYYFYRAGT